MKSSEVAAEDWPSAEEKANNAAQAKALRGQARAGGLRFSVYLPPDLADWLLELVENGAFIDPSEVVFAKLQEAQEFEPHHDLRRELLARMLDAADNDPRPGMPLDEAIKQLKEKSTEVPEPAMWQKLGPVSSED